MPRRASPNTRSPLVPVPRPSIPNVKMDMIPMSMTPARQYGGRWNQPHSIDEISPLADEPPVGSELPSLQVVQRGAIQCCM